ncbi:MAG: sensor histidine kinase [Deltaproteobacteria bacterium]|nr:sensor histidine kinase [Deltaproteobacteria bacterium]
MQDLSLHILDIVENSLAAGAKLVEIRLEEDLREDRMTIEIVDNGCGMDEEMIQRALDPFFTTKTVRRVGLGLPLLSEACRISNGQLCLQSSPGQGTKVRATFQHSHIDRQPLGNMGDTLITLIVGHPEVDLFYGHRKDGASFSLDTREIKGALGDVPLNEPRVVSALRRHILAGLEELAA